MLNPEKSMGYAQPRSMFARVQSKDIRFMNIQENDEDFSNQDIRGEDFSKKRDRRNNKFQYSKAGIRSIYRCSLIFLFFLLSILISVALEESLLPLIGGFQGNWIPILIASSMLGIFLFSITTQGFTGALLGAGTVSVIGLILIAPLLRQGEHTIVPGVFFGMFSVVIALGIILTSPLREFS
jgi:hypothetical protein